MRCSTRSLTRSLTRSVKLSPIQRPTTRLAGALLLLAMTGCQQYELTFNEQPVAGVPGLAENVQVVDPDLAECIDRVVYDQRITQLNRLSRLSCQQNSIRSLEGINQLQQLSYINLAGNALSDAAPLLSLPHLSEVDLRGNRDLECGSVRQLAARGVRVHSPTHCP